MAAVNGLCQGSSSAPSPVTPQLSPEDMWKAKVQTWYPNLFKQTHCVPHVHINRVPYRTETFAGHDVLVLDPVKGGSTSRAAQSGQTRQQGGSGQTSRPVGSCLTGAASQPGVTGRTKQPGTAEISTIHSSHLVPMKVQESDMTDDFAQQHMLSCLQALGDSRRPEAMFIISNLRFRDFLRHTPSPPPLPEGEFDIVTVSPGKGLGIGEIKSVGHNFSSLNKTEAECRTDIVNKVDKAIPQLKKQKTVLGKMLKTWVPGVPIRPFFMLPYVTRDQLRQAVESADPKKNLAKKLCQCLGAKGVQEATELCVCSDDVSDRSQPWHVTPAVLAKLDAWLLRRFGTSHRPLMSNDAYLDVISRVCGPPTAIYVHCVSPPRMEVHTIPEAVSHAGDRMSQIVLTPEQVNLLNAAPKLAWLTGPPGTGKTISVVLQCLVWLKQGFDMSTVGTPRLHIYDFWNREEDINEALHELKTSAESDGSLHLIMDDCGMPTVQFDQDILKGYRKFFSEIISTTSDLCLWGTSVNFFDLPDSLTEWKMTEPLRCPPTVLREVMPSVDFLPGMCDRYSTSVCPPPCEGPPVMWLTHSGPGHTGQWPVTCKQCGLDVAETFHVLGIGPAGYSNISDQESQPLQYRDVLILTSSSDLKDDTSASGSAQVCEFVAGLRSQGIPVRVLPWRYRGSADPDDMKIVKDLAIEASNIVTVTDPGWVGGLERKVVVVLPGRHENAQEKLQWSDDGWAAQNRFYSLSRCTSQLIVVRCPGHPLQRIP